MSDSQVLGDAELGKDAKILMDKPQSVFTRDLGIDVDQGDWFPTIEFGFASVALMNSGKYLDESRLPRSVASDQGMNLSSLHREGEVVKSTRTAEGLGEAPHA
jgi:hypothetical protein